MVQNVSFRYNDKTPTIYRNLEFGIDLDTRLGRCIFYWLKIFFIQLHSFDTDNTNQSLDSLRIIALVGKNGCGKSTLLKLIYGDLHPTEGMIRRNSHLRIARYHQHLHELLDMDMSPLDYMMKCFPDIKEREEMRKIIGRYGLTGKQQVRFI